MQFHYVLIPFVIASLSGNMLAASRPLFKARNTGSTVISNKTIPLAVVLSLNGTDPSLGVPSNSSGVPPSNSTSLPPSGTPSNTTSALSSGPTSLPSGAPPNGTNPLNGPVTPGGCPSMPVNGTDPSVDPSKVTTHTGFRTISVFTTVTVPVVMTSTTANMSTPLVTPTPASLSSVGTPSANITV
ncbi:hypothetical protein V8B97DRAFT_1092256 [Scleroderma yunnanense]